MEVTDTQTEKIFQRVQTTQSMPLQVYLRGQVLQSLLMMDGHLLNSFKTFQRLFNVQGNGKMRLIGLFIVGFFFGRR